MEHYYKPFFMFPLNWWRWGASKLPSMKSYCSQTSTCLVCIFFDCKQVSMATLQEEPLRRTISSAVSFSGRKISQLPFSLRSVSYYQLLPRMVFTGFVSLGLSSEGKCVVSYFMKGFYRGRPCHSSACGLGSNSMSKPKHPQFSKICLTGLIRS